MSVKCVMMCMTKTAPSWEGGPVQIELQPMYGDSKGNRFLNEFAKSTPCGRVSLTVDNPPAAEHFVPGKYYDLVFTQREEPAAAT